MTVDENTPLLVGERRTFSERLFGTGEKKPDTVTGTRRFIKDKYPEVDFSKLEGGGWKINFENPETEMGDIFMHGPRGGKETNHCSKGPFVGTFRYFRKKELFVSWEKCRRDLERK